MTAAERTYRLALRAYPAAYRAERGPEILATLAEMQGDRRSPEARQVVALIAGGVRAREAATTGGTTAGMWAEGCAPGRVRAAPAGRVAEHVRRRG